MSYVRSVWFVAPSLCALVFAADCGCEDDPIEVECEALGELSCDGVCVDALNDADNCGACGSACAGARMRI